MGFGAFALIVATVLAPAMPSAALGWMPGALFGLGTTVVLAGAGALIGTLVRRLREDIAQQVAQEGAGWTVLAGGCLFAAAGLASLIFPSPMSAGIATGIHVYNLDRLGLGTALIVGVVLVALIAIARAARSYAPAWQSRQPKRRHRSAPAYRAGHNVRSTQPAQRAAAALASARDKRPAHYRFAGMLLA